MEFGLEAVREYVFGDSEETFNSSGV